MNDKIKALCAMTCAAALALVAVNATSMPHAGADAIDDKPDDVVIQIDVQETIAPTDAPELNTPVPTDEPAAVPTPDATLEPTQRPIPDETTEPDTTAAVPTAVPDITVTPVAETTATPEVSPSPTPTVYTELEPGMEGEDVLRLQARLIDLQYMTLAEPDAQPDGIYDEATQTAVALFQTVIELEPTGIADILTQTILFSEDAPVNPTAESSPMPTLPAGFVIPGGWSGGIPGGAFTGMTGALRPAGIVPGQALTSSHSSGDKNMRLYDSFDTDEYTNRVELYALPAGDYSAITCTDRSGTRYVRFSAAYDAGRLYLASGSAATLTDNSGVVVWHISVKCLKNLNAAGIECITISYGTTEKNIPTNLSISGVIYDRLRANGVTPHQFDLRFEFSSDGYDGCTLAVSQELYDVVESDQGLIITESVNAD